MAKKKDLQEVKASLFETRSRIGKRKEATTDPEKLKKLEQQWAEVNSRLEEFDKDEWALIKELNGNVEDEADEANEILDESTDPVDIDASDEAEDDVISEPEPAPNPAPKKQPTPVHMPNPAAKAAPAPAAPPATPVQPVKAAEPAKGPRTLRPDGPGKIYKYWNHETSTWGFCPNKAAARQLSNVYQKVYVWYKDGEPDHIMTEGEIAKYLPK